MRTGVCYYPEHWPRKRWRDDAMRMIDCGLSLVRVGEFAWSRLEPEAGRLAFDWLEDAIDILHEAGLDIVVGTPTAAPPRWLIDRHPDILAVDEYGRTRGFGSRRHYCFSSIAYRHECVRIVTALGERFGGHSAVVAWQIDNEYGCHDTVLSYSPAARRGFQRWCRERYCSIETLNTVWGNVFWSMEYPDFDRIDLPVGAVTESNPAHRLAFWRYSSDQVTAFHCLQEKVLRRLSPGRDIVHNYMGNFVEFDHHALSDHLDVAGWDNYPLGFVTRDTKDEDQQREYYRTGTPDSSAFHHDLYRGSCHGRFWVMELQPGPVNWAPTNPAPLPGMVRLWSWEAFAHGAEVVSYFRWRQAPFAQEQMHTGLLLSNDYEDVAYGEVRSLQPEIARLVELDTATRTASVGLIFDYAGDRIQRIQQPMGAHYDPLVFTQRIYSACRSLGVDVDILRPDADFSAYKILLLPLSTESSDQLVDRLEACSADILLFPRTGSKTSEYTIPDVLPPGAFRRLIDVRIVRVESLPEYAKLPALPVDGARSSLTSVGITAVHWRESIASPITPAYRFTDGIGCLYSQGRIHYINACLDQIGLQTLLKQLLDTRSIVISELPPGLRTRRCGDLRFAFNYGPDSIHLGSAGLATRGFGKDTELLLGRRELPPAGVAAWISSID